MFSVLFGTAFLVVFLVAPVAYAGDEFEPPPAPLVESKDAELHAKLASALFKVGNYLEAASELNVAYTLQPQPVYLFNIAQAYRKGMRAQAAKVMYQRFLEVAPNHPLAAEARGYMVDMEALERAEAARDTAQQALSQAQQRTKLRGRRALFFGVGVAGAGILALAVGLGVGLSRRDPSTNGGIIELSLNASF